MSSESSYAESALLTEALELSGLSQEQQEIVRDALSAAMSRLGTRLDRGQLLTIPYDASQAEPTLAPFTEGSETTGALPEPVQPPPTSQLVAVGLLGQGGMGEVHRARDNTLDRHLAMKLLHGRLASDPRMRARFLTEAAITAQLAHPGIPPVHQLGESEDGRPFFTMKEVHGRTLADVIREHHRPGMGKEWTEGRLLDVFHRACEAVAYAHSRGVIHCDLKPPNIMVGAFGEVMVMDWGVARIVTPATTRKADEPPVATRWSDQLDTNSTIAGTPAYMPPEQATGEVDLIGPASDVFALGVILYEILAGRRPFRGDPIRMIRAISAGKIPPIEPRHGSLVDEGLLQIVHRSLACEPEDRYADAAAMADAFGRWKEGSLKREAALKVVRQAQGMLPDIEPKRERARTLRELAEQRLGALAPDATADEKAPAWGLLDEALGLDLEVTMRTTEVTQLLQGALVHVPDLPEARKLLARIHFENHQQAEQERNRAEAVHHEMLLRAYDVGDYADYLAKSAVLELRTDTDCEVVLHRFEERGRRQIAERVRSLGKAPLRAVELPVGSYLLELVTDDRPPVFCPVVLDRLEDWTGAAPGQREPTPVHLPEAGAIGPDEVYIPAGWAALGGDREAPGTLRSTRCWVPGFAIQRHPVTARQLFRFLATQGSMGGGRELLRTTGGLWRADWPAVGVSWALARAYAAWHSEQTGQDWRLPTELEWEKAARGVDGRAFPWGDFADEAFALVRAGRRVPRMPGPVRATPLDRSPYGVEGLAGNAREWCLDAFRSGSPESLEGRLATVPEVDPDDPSPRAVRGGSWRQPLELARCAARAGVEPDQSHNDLGFRLVRRIGG